MAKKILIVEDEQAFLDLYSEILEEKGYDLIFAYDGDEALMKLEETRPDLIILDLLMDMVTGDTFFLYLKGMPDFDKVPVIIISAFSQKDYKNLKKLDPDLSYIEKTHLTRDKLIEEVDRKLAGR